MGDKSESAAKEKTAEKKGGENPYKGFMQDFMIADKYGEASVRNTYKRAFDEWKDSVEYFASLVCTLNHQIWNHYEAGNEPLARVYNELWKTADEFAYEHFTGKDLLFYSNFLD